MKHAGKYKLGNVRPITFLNVTYYIYTKALKARLQLVLTKNH